VTVRQLRVASKIYQTIEPFQFYSAEVTKAREKFIDWDFIIPLKQRGSLIIDGRFASANMRPCAAK